MLNVLSHVTYLSSQSYIDKLFDIFDMSENLEDMETLHALYLIFKRISKSFLLCHEFPSLLCVH